MTDIRKAGPIPMIRHLRVGTVAAVAVALIGIPVGLLWTVIAPHGKLVVSGGQAFLANPESEAWIGADGWFAVITAVTGIVCAVVAYVLAGRLGDVALLVALAAGGILAALLAWRIGHEIGLGTLRHLIRTSRDGTAINGGLDLRAKGVLVAWPLFSVVVYGLLEAFDVANREPDRRRRRGSASRDGGQPPAGQPDQVGGGQFDLQSAPARGDVEGRET